eukprot:365108-Chlamydomonas_euryale.AAC.1
MLPGCVPRKGLGHRLARHTPTPAGSPCPCALQLQQAAVCSFQVPADHDLRPGQCLSVSYVIWTGLYRLGHQTGACSELCCIALEPYWALSLEPYWALSLEPYWAFICLWRCALFLKKMGVPMVGEVRLGGRRGCIQAEKARPGSKHESAAAHPPPSPNNQCRVPLPPTVPPWPHMFLIGSNCSSLASTVPPWPHMFLIGLNCSRIPSPTIDATCHCRRQFLIGSILSTVFWVLGLVKKPENDVNFVSLGLSGVKGKEGGAGEKGEGRVCSRVKGKKGVQRSKGGAGEQWGRR